MSTNKTRPAAAGGIQRGADETRTAWLLSLVEGLPAPALHVAPDGSIRVNDRAAALFGFDHAEIPTLDDAIARLFGAHAAAAREGLLRDRAAGWLEPRELRIRGARGTPRVVELVVHRPHADGATGEAWLLRDITEPQQALHELHELQARFAHFADAVVDYAHLTLSADGHVRTWNVGAERLTGFRADDVLGRHVDILYPPGLKEEPVRTMQAAARDGRCGAAGWRARRSGEQYWASVVFTAQHDAGQRLTGFALVIRDLSGRRAAELDRDRLLRAEQGAKAEAARARQAQANFVEVMSAEFRTPLNTIRGFTELLAMGLHGELTAEQQADLMRIQRAEHQLARLVTDLADYVTMEGGSVAIEPASVEVAPLLQDLIEENDAALAAKDLSYDASAPAGLTLWADRARLDQILGHLLESAIHSTPQGGHVFVGAARRGSAVALTVQDSGDPASPARRASLLHPFPSSGAAGASGRRDDDGSGLGLALSRALAVAMGGNLFIEDADAGGARFVLLLPGSPPADAPRAPAGGRRAHAPGRR